MSAGGHDCKGAGDELVLALLRARGAAFRLGDAHPPVDGNHQLVHKLPALAVDRARGQAGVGPEGVDRCAKDLVAHAAEPGVLDHVGGDDTARAWPPVVGDQRRGARGAGLCEHGVTAVDADSIPQCARMPASCPQYSPTCPSPCGGGYARRCGERCMSPCHHRHLQLGNQCGARVSAWRAMQRACAAGRCVSAGRRESWPHMLPCNGTARRAPAFLTGVSGESVLRVAPQIPE
mmetsp:Transcript_26688/g.89342  ORF Transcript_26688/g.89342 Transcript_26688/m.89342 type:complete len:234 (+) Transcript_26688:295-996(+)